MVKIEVSNNNLYSLLSLKDSWTLTEGVQAYQPCFFFFLLKLTGEKNVPERPSKNKN